MVCEWIQIIFKKLTFFLVRPISAVRHAIAAQFRSDALPTAAEEVFLRLTLPNPVTVLFVRVVTAVVVSVADVCAWDAARVVPALDLTLRTVHGRSRWRTYKQSIYLVKLTLHVMHLLKPTFFSLALITICSARTRTGVFVYKIVAL